MGPLHKWSYRARNYGAVGAANLFPTQSTVQPDLGRVGTSQTSLLAIILIFSFLISLFYKSWWTCFEMLSYYILNHKLVFHNNHHNLTYHNIYPNLHSNTHQRKSQHTLKHTWVSINKSLYCRRSCTYLLTMFVLGLIPSRVSWQVDFCFIKKDIGKNSWALMDIGIEPISAYNPIYMSSF